MLKTYLVSLRLAVAIVCVGVCLILGGQWLGLFPDARKAELEGRAKQCEAIAINVASLIRRESFSELHSILTLIAQRDENLASIGLRTDQGVLKFGTPGHEALWSSPLSHSDAGAKMHIPITVNRRSWGSVEICYVDDNQFASGFLSHPVAKLLIFFVLLGVAVYSFFIARMMGVFGRTQVVPERVRQALDTLAEGLLVLDEKERIILANNAFAETSGMSRDKLTGRVASQLSWVIPPNQPGFQFPWVRALSDAAAQNNHLLRYRLPNGSQRVFSSNSTPIMAADGSHRGTLATFRDVTHIEQHRAELENMLAVLQSSRDEIKRKNLELEILATQDALTGCLNRRAFFERFERLWQAAVSRGEPLSCIMIDNDHFKKINDTYGHHTGDEVLRAVSAMLREAFANTGLVCRYGGEEFCVVLPSQDVRSASQLAEQVRERMEAIRLESPAELRISASIGVSDLSFGASDPQDLTNQADMCLYVAKRQGRNRVVIFDPQMESMAGENQPAEMRAAAEPESSPSSIPFQAVTALLSALAYRDADTAEHSRRVADLCVRTARGFLSQKQIYILEIAALLHDIGKIGVPDDILLKPGKLTEDEWKIMGQHDRIGVEIVAGTFNCEILSEIIRTHHWFYAGRSAEQPLPRGADASIGSRLLTICDSYDAIISDRPYRRGKSHQEAVAELRRCAGTQFDPELVEHFVGVMEGQSRSVESERTDVSKEVALQIGLQIGRLADAADERDSQCLNALASRLAKFARRNAIDSIAEVASQLETISESQDPEWVGLLQTITELLDLCRSTQGALFADAHSMSKLRNANVCRENSRILPENPQDPSRLTR